MKAGVQVRRRVADEKYIAPGDEGPRVLMAKMILVGAALATGDRTYLPNTYSSKAGEGFGNATNALQKLVGAEGAKPNQFGPVTKQKIEELTGCKFDDVVNELNGCFTADVTA